MKNTDGITAQSAPSVLPAWLEAELPTPIEPHKLSAPLQDGVRVLRLTSPEGEFEDFPDLRSMGESKRSNGIDIVVEDEAVYAHFSDRERYLSYEVEGGYFGMILCRTDADRRRSLEQDYAEFQEAQRKYNEDPQSFLYAWRFIDCHPAFWTADNLEDHPWYWQTEGYCSKLRQWVGADEESGHYVRLEGGGHVEHSTGPGQSAYSEHYGDWRLEAAAKSFEAAIVELAKRVSSAFDSEGNSLPEDDFLYEAPQYILELRERLAEGGRAFEG